MTLYHGDSDGDVWYGMRSVRWVADVYVGTVGGRCKLAALEWKLGEEATRPSREN